MKQILKEEDIVGKTIKSSGYGNNAFCLIFTDETFCVIVGCGWDESDVMFSREEINLNLTSAWDIGYLVDMGLMSIEDGDELKLKLNEEQFRTQRGKEYQEYLKLKMKYEAR